MANECVVLKSGGPEALTLRTVPSRPCGPGQVRVRVAFIGVNFADLAVRAGVYGPAPKPPIVPGFEVAGVVEESKSPSFQQGDRVLAVSRFGGYVDELVADETRVRRIPPAMSFEEAAALPAQYLTAWHALVAVCGAKRGESVLIHAAAGGVGTAAVQLCRELGLRSIGTASTDAKLDFARSQGLDVGINYAREDFEEAVRVATQGAGVDIALDANGGRSYGKSFRALAPGGRLVVYGAAAALPSSLKAVAEWPRTAWELAHQKWFHPFELIDRNVSVCGLQLLRLWDRAEVLGQELDELLRLYDRGAIRPHIDRVFPMEDVAAAHRYLHDRSSRGKVLLATAR